MEQFLQETVFQTNESRHAIHLVAQVAAFGSSPEYFLAQVTSFTQHTLPYVSVNCLPERYINATEAFRDAFNWVRHYAEKNTEEIIAVDNPCNCPFISKDDQQAIIATAGLQLPIQVNGQ